MYFTPTDEIFESNLKSKRVNEMDEIAFKRLAGCLLKYYRTHVQFPNSKKRLSLKEIVQINTPEIQEVKEIYQRKLGKPFFCSTTKLASIEKGKVDHSDFVYECVCVIFSKCFLYRKQLVKRLQNCMISVYNGLENPNDQHLQFLLVEINQAIERFKDYLVYHEILLLLQACLFYFYYNRLPTKKEIDLFEVLYSIKLDKLEPFYEMLGFILTIYAIKTNQIPLNQFSLPNTSCIIVVKSRFAFYFKQKKLDLALDAIEVLRSHPDYWRNYGWQLDYYSYQALALISCHAHFKAAHCISECYLLMQQHDLLKQTYYRTRFAFVQGVYYLSKRSYLKAYESFWKASPERTYWSLPLMAFCLKKLHLPKQPFQKLLLNLQTPIPEGVIESFVNYFRYKFSLAIIRKQEARFLEDMLVNTILRQLSKNHFVYMIFYHELIELTQISKRSELLLSHTML